MKRAAPLPLAGLLHLGVTYVVWGSTYLAIRVALIEGVLDRRPPSLLLVGSIAAGFVGLVILTRPMIAVLLGWLILSEPITASTFGGMVLILVGVFGVFRDKSARTTRR